jgi:hypothetical protein
MRGKRKNNKIVKCFAVTVIINKPAFLIPVPHSQQAWLNVSDQSKIFASYLFLLDHLADRN